MLNYIIYFLCLILLVLCPTLLKKDIVLRPLLFFIVGQTIIINLFNSDLDKPEKVGPISFENHIKLLQLLILIFTLYIIYKYKRKNKTK